MKWGVVIVFCPFCKGEIAVNLHKGYLHSKEWGYVCSQKCWDYGELAYARMILGKDTP